MRKSFTKACALVMAAAMAVTGCGNASKTEPSAAAPENTAGESTAAATEAQNVKPEDIVDINVMVYDRGSEFSSGNSLTDNELTRWINEAMEPQGVHVNFVPVPRSGADDQVNLMLTAGTAPDIIRTYDRQRVATYGSQGGLVDLGPYLDRMDPKYVSENQEAIEFAQFDGKQYALPGVYSYHGKGHDTYIRQDLVEKMGMEMPTDREELIEVLYAMKENYPDITPYAFAGKITDGNYTNFLLSYVSRENERDNYIYEPTFTTVLKPGHKDGLRQLNLLILL
jgi:putative aldouronate transport system substrate-binding protein